MVMSSNQGTSRSSVKALETLTDSPPRPCHSNCKALLGGIGIAPERSRATGGMVRSHRSITLRRCCPQISVKPSEHNMRYLRRGLCKRSSGKCVTSGIAEMYGGVLFSTRNSSHSEVSLLPGKRLYRRRLVNSGGCLNGVSPKHRKGAIAPKTRPSMIQSGSPGCSLFTRSTSRLFCPLCTLVKTS